MNTVSTKSRDTIEYSKYKEKIYITIQSVLTAVTTLLLVLTEFKCVSAFIFKRVSV